MEDSLTQATRRSRGNRSRPGFTLVEMLLALAIAGLLGAALATALDASFMAYANSSEMASTNTSSRLVMQRLMAMVRTSSLHDAYDPDDSNVSLLEPTHANHPLQCVGMQMRLPDGKHIKVWWQANTAYGDADVGDLMYSDDEIETATLGPQLLLARAKCQRTASDEPYVFTLGSRTSDIGLLLARATLDLTVYPDPQAMFSSESGIASNAPVRLVGSSMPRKNMRD